MDDQSAQGNLEPLQPEPVQSPPPEVNPEPLVYEETPILTPLPQPSGPASGQPLSKQKVRPSFIRLLGRLGFVVVLFGIGFGLSAFLKEYLVGGLPSTPLTPSPSPSTLAVVPPAGLATTPVAVGDPLASWKSYQVLSGLTKQPISVVTYKLPPDVLSPICDGTSCASQGTYLPGGTRFTVAPRGVGQILPDFRGKIVSELGGKEFAVTEATISGHPGVSFSARFTGATSGGYSFTQMKGLMIELDDKLSLEINHFTPAGVNADFAIDDQLFDQIITNLVFSAPFVSASPAALPITPNPTLSAQGQICGGIAANLPQYQCPSGYYCKLSSTYPDATGKCTRVQ